MPDPSPPRDDEQLIPSRPPRMPARAVQLFRSLTRYLNGIGFVSPISAAKLLGVSRYGLQKMLKRLELN